MIDCSDKPMVVFDLDGVIISTPSGQTISDSRFWDRYWRSDLWMQRPNLPMVQLFHALRKSWYVAILTARPKRYARYTIYTLDQMGIECEVVPHLLEATFGNHRTPIQMWDGTVEEAVSSSVWKARIIEDLMAAGIQVNFMVEDYKPNADTVRQHVPVLLYERLR